MADLVAQPSRSRKAVSRPRRLAVERLEDRLTPSGETVAVTLGTLPAGRAVAVSFDATIDSPLTKGIDRVFNQGTVSGTNFAAVRTDDPAAPGTTDPTVTLVDRAPMVARVFVRSSAWNATFLNALQAQGVGDATFGYALTTGATQLNTLPWLNLDRVSVRFTENVTVAADDLQLFGVATANYALTGFTYDPVTFTATWTVTGGITADQLRLVVDGSAAGVTDTAGSRLDGEWLDGTAVLPSGDGAAGGNFSVRFNVQPGDVNGDQLVNTTDLVIVRRNFTTTDRQSDLNGDGTVNAADFDAGRPRIGTVQPAGTPGGTPGSGWAAAVTPTPPNPPGGPGTTVTATNVDSL